MPVLATAAAVALLTMMLVRTRSGTVVIDVDPPGAEVSIDDGKITLVVPDVKEPIEMRLKPGEHTFEVHHGGFATKTGSFTLDAGGRQVLAVKLQQAPPLPPPSPEKPSLPKLVIGESIPLFTSPDQLLGWEPLIDRIRYSNRTLETRQVAYLNYRVNVKDVRLRARAKGDDMGIFLRVSAKGAYGAWFKRREGRWGIGKMENHKWIDLVIRDAREPYDGFIDVEFSAVGDTLTLSVNGKPLLQSHDSSQTAGKAGISGGEVTLFTDVAMLIPTKESLVADNRRPPGQQPPPGVVPFDEKKAKSLQSDAASRLGMPVEIANSIGIKLVLIPSGEFMMGSTEKAIANQRDANYDDPLYCNEFLPWEVPQHRVRITRPYYLGRCLVTQSQYERVTGVNPSQFAAAAKAAVDGAKVAGEDTREYPVEMVAWEDAVAFCQRLSASPEEKSAKRIYRLPTEAEWEYACRCSTTTARFYQADDIERYAWFVNNSGGKPHPVGRKAPNAWGLCDMYGNLWEWCSDWYGKDYYQHSPVDDPPGPASGQQRVVRGGCWGWYVCYCRSACRHASIGPGYGTGFRIVCEIAHRRVRRRAFPVMPRRALPGRPPRVKARRRTFSTARMASRNNLSGVIDKITWAGHYASIC